MMQGNAGRVVRWWLDEWRGVLIDDLRLILRCGGLKNVRSRLPKQVLEVPELRSYGDAGRPTDY
jgi:hypothetical protein